MLHEFERILSKAEKRALVKMTTPGKIQNFLDFIPYSSESIYRCPLRVLRERVAHCFDGALFAAAALQRIGYPSLIMDLIPTRRDDDHVLALFKIEGYWGAIAKSNFTGLRYREPIYRTLRELALSYFEQYYNVAGEKTLRGYTGWLNLRSFDKMGWMYQDEPLQQITRRLDEIRRYSLMTRGMIHRLQKMDPRSYQAGLSGSDKKGLFKPNVNQ